MFYLEKNVILIFVAEKGNRLMLTNPGFQSRNIEKPNNLAIQK